MTTVKSLLGFEETYSGKDVGIEIEVEGIVPETIKSRVWKAVPDGSLRGGMEYVTKRPLAIIDVGRAIDEIVKIFTETGAKPSFSFRTSVHVHLNMYDATYTDVLKVLYMFWMFEPVIIRASGKTRRANRFCLSTQDSDMSFNTIIAVMLYRGGDKLATLLSGYREERNKYSAINIASLRKHGTIEIRTMEGNLNQSRIVSWCQFLNSLKKAALKYENLFEIEEAISSNGPRVFLKELLGDNFSRYDFPELEDEIALQQSLLIDVLYTSKKAFNERKNKPVQARESEREEVVGGAEFTGHEEPPSPFWMAAQDQAGLDNNLELGERERLLRRVEEGARRLREQWAEQGVEPRRFYP